jgi:hypothetical protein
MQNFSLTVRHRQDSLMVPAVRMTDVLSKLPDCSEPEINPLHNDILHGSTAVWRLQLMGDQFLGGK